MTTADRITVARMERVPLAFAIGMRVGAVADGRAEAALPTGAAIADADGAVDPLALLPFIDQLSSVPLVAANAGTAMATIELAVQFAAPAPVGPFHGLAEAVTGAGAARLVTSRVTGADGRVAATGSAWFSLGAPPGGGEGGGDLPVPAFVPAGPFQRMIGLDVAGEDGATLAPDVEEAVGWVGMPALHGGAVAALLARAAQRRLETRDAGGLRLAGVTIRYLRAAATSGTVARARVDALGRRTARLSVTAETAGAVVASAQVLFVA